MNVVAVKANKNNKVDITLDELNKLLNDAYNEGVRKGQENTKIYIPTATPAYQDWFKDHLNVTYTSLNSNIKAKMKGE